MIIKLEDVEIKGWSASDLMTEVVEYIQGTYQNDHDVDLLILQKNNTCQVIWRSPGERGSKALAAKVTYSFFDDVVLSEGKYTGKSELNLSHRRVSDTSEVEEVFDWIGRTLSEEVDYVLDNLLDKR